MGCATAPLTAHRLSRSSARLTPRFGAAYVVQPVILPRAARGGPLPVTRGPCWWPGGGRQSWPATGAPGRLGVRGGQTQSVEKAVCLSEARSRLLEVRTPARAVAQQLA